MTSPAPRGPLLPSIQPNDWPERAFVVHRSLCSLPRLPGTPWVGLRREGGTFLTPSGLRELGRSVPELEAEAVLALPAPSSGFRPVAMRVGDGGGVVELLVHTEPMHAPERLLDERFLEQAHRLLGAEHLAAAVPHRRALLVTAYERVQEGLFEVAADYCAKAAPFGLSPMVFLVSAGRVAGRITNDLGRIGIEPAG